MTRILKPTPGVASNLDCREHGDGFACPCLPPIWYMRFGDRVGVKAYHDAHVARVLRGERGHP